MLQQPQGQSEPGKNIMQFVCLLQRDNSKSLEQAQVKYIPDSSFKPMPKMGYFDKEGKQIKENSPQDDGFTVQYDQKNKMICIDDPRGRFIFWTHVNQQDYRLLKLNQRYKIGTREWTVADLYDWYQSDPRPLIADFSKKINGVCYTCKKGEESVQNPLVRMCNCTNKYNHLMCIRQYILNKKKCTIITRKDTKYIRFNEVHCQSCYCLASLYTQRNGVIYPILDYKATFQLGLQYDNFSDQQFQRSQFPQNFINNESKPYSNFVVLKSRDEVTERLEIQIANIKQGQTILVGSSQTCNMVMKDIQKYKTKHNKIQKKHANIINFNGGLYISNQKQDYEMYEQIQVDQKLKFDERGLKIQYCLKSQYQLGKTQYKYMIFRFKGQDQSLNYYLVKKQSQVAQDQKYTPSCLMIDVYNVCKKVDMSIAHIKKHLQNRMQFVSIAKQLNQMARHHVNRNQDIRFKWIHEHFILHQNEQNTVIIKNKQNKCQFWIATGKDLMIPLRKGAIYRMGPKIFEVFDIYNGDQTNLQQITTDIRVQPVREKCMMCYATGQTNQNPLLRYCDCCPDCYMHIKCLRDFVARDAITAITRQNFKYVRKNVVTCNKCIKSIPFQLERNSVKFPIIDYRQLFYSQAGKDTFDYNQFPFQRYHQTFANSALAQSKFVVLRSIKYDNEHRPLTQLYIANLNPDCLMDIGRDQPCPIRIILPEISRNTHASIYYKEDQLYLVDRNSFNGTLYLMNKNQTVEFGNKDGVLILCQGAQVPKMGSFVWIKPYNRSSGGQDQVANILSMQSR